MLTFNWGMFWALLAAFAIRGTVRILGRMTFSDFWKEN